MKKFIFSIIVFVALAAAGVTFIANQPIIGREDRPIEFSVKAGSSVRSTSQQIAEAGVPVNPWVFELLARLTGKASRLKAGSYEAKPGTTPLTLIDQLVRGEFAQEGLAIIEGWSFKQMRQAIAAHPAIRHDTAGMSDRELLEKIGVQYTHPEGLFFPDTYRFAKGASDLIIYKQAHALLQKRLNEAWARRSPSVPYKSPYEALIMASIIEKETGQKSERNLIAAVFVNRLRKGMLLQTDPTVIYGMGEKFQGNIRKRDLETDTPYNTYMRVGLPPTPIALPGAESLEAALNPANSDALYFVARGNGTSEFNKNLADHNRAVNKYQR
ncbi:endolytic transglycosylase MltG [Noviherbaspirillum sp. Root189]|uniref:endolytic transglycosylase MltG n=1 Tax=Noviherbaspirillum sp. Root189 TaxID=1736487 RepID=UPI00070F5FA7|nr:endolytic transglycosylase MltG [Noviherbaspirillum sp. Root189]KRB78321.1 aminodeoxychorismate lyase [Noviherbaspirillum sp. Root189]